MMYANDAIKEAKKLKIILRQCIKREKKKNQYDDIYLFYWQGFYDCLDEMIYISLGKKNEKSDKYAAAADARQSINRK